MHGREGAKIVDGKIKTIQFITLHTGGNGDTLIWP